MKYVFANLKRFDVPTELDGINAMAKPEEWGGYIAKGISRAMEDISEKLEVVLFFPEAQIVSAKKEKGFDQSWKIGCQGVYRKDVEKNGNYGAFTTNKTAKSMVALGCEYTIIGHCEERMDKNGILKAAGNADAKAVNQILNEEIQCAIGAGMKVLYCVGEKTGEQGRWQDIIGEQLEVALQGNDKTKVIIGYEPLWAIGPGKPVPSKEYIGKIVRFIKEKTSGCPVLYGGGMKVENSEMLASMEELDGGLIGLTKFTGDIGFYPEGFQEIVNTYLGKTN